jgi:hypothetical protein
MKRTAEIIQRELAQCRQQMMRADRYSRTYRALELRHKALALELALTTGTLSLGVV